MLRSKSKRLKILKSILDDYEKSEVKECFSQDLQTHHKYYSNLLV